MTQPLVDGKYRLPSWTLRRAGVSVGIIVAKRFLPVDVWGPSAVAGIAAMSGLALIYNKVKKADAYPTTGDSGSRYASF